MTPKASCFVAVVTLCLTGAAAFDGNVTLSSSAGSRIKVVSYNMAGGASSSNLMSKKERFYGFSRLFESMYKADPSATWIICVQEINRDDDTWYYEGDSKDNNQVEMLQKKLNLFTGVYWYKHSATRPWWVSLKKPAVAIFSTSELVKVQRWDLPQDRKAVAVKVALEDSAYVWVVDAHLTTASSDSSGKDRKDSVNKMLANIATFDATVPVIVTGDFNIYDATPGCYSSKYASVVSADVFNQTVGKFTSSGFTRGESFEPSAAFTTVKTWDNFEDGAILDYVLMNERGGKCNMGNPTIVQEKAVEGKYMSDHRGMVVEITCGFADVAVLV